MKSEDIKQKIVDKKLSDVVDLVEDKPKNVGLFDDLEDDLGDPGGSLGDRKTTLPTYAWEDTKSRERLDERTIRETGRKSGVPVTWKFASEKEADKSIARRDKLDEVMQEAMSRFHNLDGCTEANLEECYEPLSLFIQEIVEYAYKEGAHFRKEND